MIQLPTTSDRPAAQQRPSRRYRGWCIWAEKKGAYCGFRARLGKRLFGRIKERWFQKRTAAQAWVTQETKRVALIGQTAWDISRDQLLDWERVSQFLEGARREGLSLPRVSEMVESAIVDARQLHRAKSVSVLQAIQAWTSAKAKKSAVHVGKCGATFRAFSNYIGEATPVFKVAAPDAQKWADSLCVSDNSRTRYVRRLSSLWQWAMKAPRHWAVENPWLSVETEPLRHQRPGILTLVQVEALLRTAAAEPGQPMLPFLVLALWAGPRIAENRRLTWESVSWDPGHEGVEFVPEDTKTGIRRFVPLPSVAVEWLSPFSTKRKDDGICPKSWEFRRDRLLARAGFKVKARTSNNGTEIVRPEDGQSPRWEWPRNGLRHSFCSYALAHLRNLDEVALRAGNTPSVLRRDYDGVVKPKDAMEYFALTPERVLGTAPTRKPEGNSA